MVKRAQTAQVEDRAKIDEEGVVTLAGEDHESSPIFLTAAAASVAS